MVLILQTSVIHYASDAFHPVPKDHLLNHGQCRIIVNFIETKISFFLLSMEKVALPQGTGTESRTGILEACYHKAQFKLPHLLQVGQSKYDTIKSSATPDCF